VISECDNLVNLRDSEHLSMMLLHEFLFGEVSLFPHMPLSVSAELRRKCIINLPLMCFCENSREVHEKSTTKVWHGKGLA
jgi:hypothetical protein